METYVRLINESLKRLFRDTDRRYRLRRISPLLFDVCRDFVLRPGKRIRPLLFLLAYQGYARKKRPVRTDLATASAAIELLHDYMLIHDDVIDRAATRRGKPTMHRVFNKKVKTVSGESIGESLAVIAGDIIFALAIESFLAVREDPRRKEAALRHLVATAAYTGAGEFIDIVFGHTTLAAIREKNVIDTNVYKTAKYTFECPLLMGAVLAGAPEAERRKLSRLGLTAGQAFQLYDDFLDTFGTPRLIGKPVLTDLAESKKTLLVYTAYRRLKGAKKRRLRHILEKKKKTQRDLAAFKDLIRESGSYAVCLTRMRTLQRQAACVYRRLAMKDKERLLLGALIEKLSPTELPVAL
jgi:geranylgeranyl diphosphate synthase type I